MSASYTAFLLSLAVLSVQGRCPGDFLEIGRSCYFFSSLDASFAPLNWLEANNYCDEKGGYLVEIDSDQVRFLRSN